MGTTRGGGLPFIFVATATAVLLIPLVFPRRPRAPPRPAVCEGELASLKAEFDGFLYSVSHDLRAPLRSIDGFAQALEEECGAQLPEDGRRDLARVRAAAGTMNRLLDDLLALSRVSCGEMHRQRLDLSAMAQTILEGLAANDPGRVIEVEVAPGVEGEGDARLVRLLLTNLLENAWKFTSKKERARIRFGGDAASGYFVEDDGVGFDMAWVDRLFGAFQRLHPADQFQGTGIGLATVKRIVARHGGRVQAEGAEDRGARFTFTLG